MIHHDVSPLVWWTIGLGAVAACVVGLLFASSGSHPLPIIGENGSHPSSEFAMRYGGSTVWYSVRGNRVMAESGPSTGRDVPLSVVEALSPHSGLYPVIALMPGTNGQQPEVGIADTNGAFLALDASANPKEGLSSDGGTRIAYAAFAPAPGIAAGGPAALFAATASSSGSWQVRVVDLSAASPKPVSVGQGSDPRFLPDGSILALGSEGIVRIDPATRARTVVVPHATGAVGSYAVSPDLSFAALSDLSPAALGGASVTVYAISSDGQAASVGSVPEAFYPIAFTSDNSLIGVNIASSTVSFYRAGASGMSLAGVLPLIVTASSTAP
jgi:hypothetical protein